MRGPTSNPRLYKPKNLKSRDYRVSSLGPSTLHPCEFRSRKSRLESLRAVHAAVRLEGKIPRQTPNPKP